MKNSTCAVCHLYNGLTLNKPLKCYQKIALLISYLSSRCLPTLVFPLYHPQRQSRLLSLLADWELNQPSGILTSSISLCSQSISYSFLNASLSLRSAFGISIPWYWARPLDSSSIFPALGSSTCAGLLYQEQARRVRGGAIPYLIT